MKREFYLAKEQKRVRIEYKPFFRGIKIYLDDELVGSPKNLKELKAGKEFPLGSENLLKVYYLSNIGRSGFDVYYNYVPLAGSFSTLDEQSKFVFVVFMYVALANIFASMISVSYNPEILFNLNAHALLAFGLFFLMLSYLVKHGNLIAAKLGTVIFILDFILVIILGVVGKNQMFIGALGTKTLISAYLINALIGMGDDREKVKNLSA